MTEQESLQESIQDSLKAYRPIHGSDPRAVENVVVAKKFSKLTSASLEMSRVCTKLTKKHAIDLSLMLDRMRRTLSQTLSPSCKTCWH